MNPDDLHPSSPDLAVQLAEAQRRLAETQARLGECEETLEAIRTGAVDALVVAGPAGSRVFSLEGAETPYRSLVEEINEGALLLRPDGNILYANARFAQLANTSLDQVIGCPCRRFFLPADHPRLEALLKAARRGGRWEEFALQSQPGAASRPVELSVSPLKDTQAETLSVIVSDLTDRKAAEHALRQANVQLEARVEQRTSELTCANESLLLGSLRQHELTEEAERLNAQLRTEITERQLAEEARARLAAIVQWSEDGIVSKALDGTIRTWNAGAERMFGYRAEEVIGRSVTILIPPDRVEEENQVVERLKCGKATEHFETVRVAKDGRRLDVSLTISPLKDGQGRVVGASKIVREIGDIVRARRVLARSKEELERLVEQRTGKLREAMAELEYMSYSMVHDMRAPLRAMQSFAAMLEEEWAGCSQPPGLDYLRRIRESASRLDRLVIDALHYGRIVRQELPATPVDVGRLMRGMIETYPDLQPAAADIAIELNEVVVLGNESLLTQCLGNLLGNAAKFVAPGVRPRIRVWAESRPAPAGSPLSSRGEGSRRDGSPQPSPFTPHTSGTNPFPFMRIWIQDNGIGIPKDAQEKIFRMFQRMHRESDYPGTGIGLAIVRKAAERMGGRVGLESEPGRGSKFWIELPIAAEGESRAFMQDAA